MQNTAILGLPWAELTDVPNAQTLSRNIAEAMDTQGIPRFATGTARDAAITAPIAGMRCYVTGRGSMEYTGTKWIETRTRTAMKTVGNQDVVGTTLTDTTELTLTAYANASYQVHAKLFVLGSSVDNMKLAMSFSTPLESFLGQDTLYTNPIDNVEGEIAKYANYGGVSASVTPDFFVKLDDQDYALASIRGVIRTGVTDSVIQVQHAQYTASGGAARVAFLSTLSLKQIG